MGKITGMALLDHGKSSCCDHGGVITAQGNGGGKYLDAVFGGFLRPEERRVGKECRL